MQTDSERELRAGGSAARLPEFGRYTASVELAGRILCALILVLALIYFGGIAIALNFADPKGAAYQIDFTPMWAAAKLAVAGHSSEAFDWRVLRAVQSTGADESAPVYFWLYPPSFLLLMLPFGTMGFSPAFAAFSAIAAGCYRLALRAWQDSGSGAVSLALAAPAVGFTLLVGNLSLIWTAAAMLALHNLSRNRPGRAGVFIAFLTIKPQLGLLIPVVLVAGRYWRTTAMAAFFTVAFAAASAAAFGADDWRLFFTSLAERSQTLVGDDRETATMVTWYAFIRQAGSGHSAAMVLQAGCSVATAAAVALAWYRTAGNANLRNAALLLAIPLATPYAYQYELVLAVAAALLLVRAGAGRSQAGRTWIATLWALPVPGWIIPGLEIAHYAAPVLSLSLAASLVLDFTRRATP